MSQERLPARRVLSEAEQSNRQRGHENRGFLSYEYGFMPTVPPLRQLPTSHRAWDEIASQLPDLYRTVGLRRAFDELPRLPADREHLPDAFLLRASALLSILSHACARAEPGEPAALPAAIDEPWRTVTTRLGRRAPVLSYIDLIVYNWQLLDAARPDPLRVENMRLLLPTVGNREEQIFYLTQVEMLAQCTPVVRASVRAQEAAARDDASALKQELVIIADCLYDVSHGSFMQINPNPHSANYVDPVVWAKTVAPFAVPIHDGVQGPSGTSSPIFHLLDLFFQRRDYASILGQESLHLRGWYPAHWREFLAAVGEISVPDYVMAKGDRELMGRYGEALNAYAGEDGFLGRHRLKVYGYLELAFKIGRSVTIGGFSGLFQDRTWDEVDDALEAARLEREQRGLTGWHTVSTLGRTASVAPDSAAALVLDVAGAGIRVQPGDRCCILPENDPLLVAKTLRALGAGGDEPVLLNRVWRRALLLRSNSEQKTELPLHDLLRLGRIRPVERSVAKLLHRITANGTLAHIIEARAEDQWELWDLLSLLARDGFDPTILWQAHPGDRESVCWIVPPESYRMYSVAAAVPTEDGKGVAELHLLTAPLRYTTAETSSTRQEQRRGTASSFVARLAQQREPQPVAVKMVRPPRFHPPASPARPLVLLAGGTGVAPFRSFIQHRCQQANAAPVWLFYAARTRRDLPFETELAQAVAAGLLHLHIAFSQEDVALELAADASGFCSVPGQRQRIDGVMLADENARALWALLRGDAVFYICGRAGFAETVVAALKAIIERFTPGTPAEGAAAPQQMLYRLVAEERLHQEVYTTYTGTHVEAQHQIDLSEIVLHNDDEHGHWIALDGRVYDLTEFLHMHPGGVKILRGYAGMDGTPAYRKVLHHARPEVHAQLALYEIGVVRRLHFGNAGGIALTAGRPRFVTLAELYRCWVRFLYLVVEMENALRNDYSIRAGALTEHGTAAEQSAYKLQLVAEVHKRCVFNYLQGLVGSDLTELWAVVAGLCAPEEDVRWLKKRLTDIAHSQGVRTVESMAERLGQPVYSTRTTANEKRAALLSLLEQKDKRFLHEMKMLLRSGLQCFEQHGAATLQVANGALTDVIRRVPALLDEYYARAADAADP